jgi:hypothetical protein
MDEFGIALALAYLTRALRGGGAVRAVMLGLAAGAAIFLCYFAAFVITDGRSGVSGQS